MKTTNEGFTLVEIVAAVAIIGIFLGITLWNVPSLRQESKLKNAVHRALLISTAKEAYLREGGINALEKYVNANNDNERFDLVKEHIPYVSLKTSINEYMQQDYEVLMGEPGLKVSLFKKNTKEEIYY